MKTLVALALIIGGGTFAHARASWHQSRMPPHAESFVGSVADPSFVSPRARKLGTCNGGPCTLTGGPSGGPNQS